MEKIIFILFFIGGVLIAKDVGVKKESEGKGKILMVIAQNNFRDEEYFVPKQIFTEKGYKVITASSSLKEAKGMLGGKAKPDILLQDVKDVSIYNAVVFVGGMGSTEYWDSKIAHNIVNEAVKNNKVLGAICLAPGTLAKAGVLKNKRATVFESANNVLKANGAILVNSDVVTDGKIVTANGPAAAEKFARSILELLEK